MVLLALLGIGAACAMGWYILAGHGWNVTASNIDDSIGQMDGYTVLLIEGTRDPAAIAAKEAAARAASKAASSAASDAVIPAQEDADPAAQGEVPQQDAPITTADQDPATAAPADEDASGQGASLQDAEEQDERESTDEEVTIENLERSYREKGAEVYRIRPMASGLYDEALVVSRGAHRIGVLAMGTPARPAAVQVAAKKLARSKVDMTVVLTSDASLADARLRGIDIIVTDVADEEPRASSYGSSAYCVSTPKLGQVEAVIISPSGVLSSKTIGKPASAEAA